MKIICIYHSRDLDGMMSAAIVKKWWLNQTNDKEYIFDINEALEFEANGDKVWLKRDEYVTLRDFNKGKKTFNYLYMLGWDYGNPIPDLSKYDKVIMCDISFPKEEMNKVLWNTKPGNFIWIDHHISAINTVDNTDKIEGLRNVNYATCELTWKYFFPNEEMPEIVRLLGMYDSFRHKGTNEEQKVLEFQYGARESISNYEEAYDYLKATIVDKRIIRTINSVGVTIYNYLCMEAKQIYSKAFPITFNRSNKSGCCMYCGSPEVAAFSMRTKYDCNTTSYDDRSGSWERGDVCKSNTTNFLAVNQERFNPINFGIDYHKDRYDGFACFWYKDGKWIFNLYNDNGEVDCSEIAKHFGGSGHKGAAGFVCDDKTMFNIINNK